MKDGWQDVREKGMNATVSQLTANKTKRLKKLFKHFKTPVERNDVKLDSLALISLRVLN